MRAATETRVAAAGFSYRVERSARRTRTMRLFVERDGAVVVQAPLRVPVREFTAMVDEKAAWVLQRKAALAAAPAAPQRQFVSGEKVFVDGEEAVIEVDPAPSKLIEIGFANGVLSVALPGNTLSARGQGIARWFAAYTNTRALAAIDEWAPRMGVRPKDLIVKDQKRRWGSCATAGVIRINWRLSMLPPECFEYVVVHELAHLKQPNHSFLFWMEVAAALPDYAARKAKVRAFEGRIDW